MIDLIHLVMVAAEMSVIFPEQADTNKRLWVPVWPSRSTQEGLLQDTKLAPWDLYLLQSETEP